MAEASVNDYDKAPPPALLKLVGGAGTGLPGDAAGGFDPALIPIVKRESGGRPYVGYTSPETLKANNGQYTDLHNAPIDANGAPVWAGDRGPGGISHAFGPAQIQPKTWGPIAKKLGITDWRAPGAYEAVANELHRQQGNAPWAASAQPIIEAARERQKNDFATADQEQKLLQAAIAKIGTGGRTADQQRELSEARAKADAAVDRATKLLEHPPELEDRGIVERMGGLATVIGLLGGLLTKQPFMGSMSAAASAMEAYNAGDMRKYQVARENWRTQSDLLFKIAEINNKRASDILQDQHMNEQEKTAELTALFSAAGAEGAIGLLRDKGLGAVQDVLQKQDDVANEWKRLEKQEQIAHDNRIFQNDMSHPELQIYREMLGQFERPVSDGGAGRHATPEERGEMLAKAKGTVVPPEQKVPTAWEGMPEAPPPGVRQDVWDAALVFTRTGKMPSLGFQPGMRNLIMAAEPAARFALGIKPTELADVQAQYAGERHAEVLLGGRTANLGLALNEAKQFIPMGDEASSKVHRSQFPTLNKVYEAALQGTGDENIVRLVTATNAITNAYAQVAARGGQSTDAARAQAHEILNVAFARGQYAVAADQMMREINAAQAAPVSTQNDILKAFSTKWNADKAPKYFVGQVIDTPKGRYFVTGGDLSGDPDIKPIQ